MLTTEQIEQFELKRMLQIVTRKKWLIVTCIIFTTLIAAVVNHFYTPIYRAQTVIVFEEQPGSTSLIVPFRTLTKSFITNQIEEIKSRSLAEEVLRALPPGIINTFPLPKKTPPHFNKEDYLSYQIQQCISAIPVPNSEVIKIQVKAYSPIAAKVIANTVAEVYQNRNLKVRREESSNVRQIIEEQLVSFKSQLDSAELALKRFKERSNVAIISKEVEEIYKRITEAEIAYNQTKANLDAAQKRLSFIQSKLAAERKDLVPSITQITSPWAKKLKQQLVDLQVQYTTLQLQNYSDDHPKMRELKKQIEKTKNNLKTESFKIASGENIVDPLTQIQKYMEESISLEIEIQTYRAQEKTLKSVIDRYKRNLNTLPDKELQLAQLLRNKEVSEKIYLMLLQKKEEAKIAEAEKVGNIRIIDLAKIPAAPYQPHKKLNLFIGMVLGFVLGIALAFTLELLDSSIKSEEDAERFTGLIVLGTIPKLKAQLIGKDFKAIKKKAGKNVTKSIAKLVTMYNPSSFEAELFRSIKSNILFSKINSDIKSVLITSTHPHEGKSIITANLAIATAQSGLKTLIIDADLRKPILHTLFQREREPGLTDFLISPKSTISTTDIKDLDLLTCGTLPFDPSEILAATPILNFIREIRNQYDAVFIDTPPINLFNDAAILSSIVDGTVLVVKAGNSQVKDVIKAKEILHKAKSNIIGLIINQIDTSNGYSKYYDYYYQNDDIKRKKIKKTSFDFN